MSTRSGPSSVTSLTPSAATRSDLGDDLRGRARHLAPARGGHDAVGAAAVAAHRDLHPRLELALALHREVAGEALELEEALRGDAVARQELGELVHLPGSEGHVHEREHLEDLVLQRLGPAAADPDHPLRVLRLQPLGLAEVADEPVVGLLADRAGVEEDQVGAVARSPASLYPSDSSIPFIRSESCSFIWHPKVVRWYVFTAPRIDLRRRGKHAIHELQRRPALEHRRDVVPVEDQRQAGRHHEVRGVELRPAEHSLADPPVDPVEQRGQLLGRVALGVRAGGEDAARGLGNHQPARALVPVEQVAEPPLAGRAGELLGVAADRRARDPAGGHLERVVRPPLRLLDGGPLARVGREQRRLRVFLVQEAGDPVVRRDAPVAGLQRPARCPCGPRT